jgi:hypothetical protein
VVLSSNTWLGGYVINLNCARKLKRTYRFRDSYLRLDSSLTPWAYLNPLKISYFTVKPPLYYYPCCRQSAFYLKPHSPAPAANLRGIVTDTELNSQNKFMFRMANIRETSKMTLDLSDLLHTKSRDRNAVRLASILLDIFRSINSCILLQ